MTKKISFKLPAKYVSGARGAILVGSFNDWDTNQGIPMQAQEDGSMKVELSLESGEAYEYRYLLSDGRWVNDDGPKKMVEAFGYKIENCVLAIPAENKKSTAAKTKSAETKPATKSISKDVKPTKVKSVATSNDLTKILGVNKKIAAVLNAEGIKTYADLGKCTMKQLMLILENAKLDNKTKYHPTWTKQAKWAAADKWDELLAYQSDLKA